MSLTPFFRTEGRIAGLLLEAGNWFGTPWMPNSAAKGMGVACHLLPTEIYKGCGALGEDFPTVKGLPNPHAKVSEMIPFLDGRPEFERLPLDLASLRPGDLIGLRVRRVVDHLGIILNEGGFVHVLMHKRTDVDCFRVPPWEQRIEAAWRPVEVGNEPGNRRIGEPGRSGI